VELGDRQQQVEQLDQRLHPPERGPGPDRPVPVRHHFRRRESGRRRQPGYTSFGSEPFTPFNLLRYNTFQAQDNFTWFSKKNSITMGGSVEKYHSDNSFYFGVQSAYTYNSLADFYADANGFLANPNRTVSPVTLRRFEVKNSLVPGETIPRFSP
jgi:hypothetical protein